jgi:hypothetical protein
MHWCEGVGATRWGDAVRVLVPGSRRPVPLAEVDQITAKRAIRAIEQAALRSRRRPHPLAQVARRLRKLDEHVDRAQYERAIELSFTFDHPREELECLIAAMNATTLWLFLSRCGPFIAHAEEAIMRWVWGQKSLSTWRSLSRPPLFFIENGGFTEKGEPR